jgi:RNA polymerase sigma-70 factor, ECF subfamily
MILSMKELPARRLLLENPEGLGRRRSILGSPGRDSRPASDQLAGINIPRAASPGSSAVFPGKHERGECLEAQPDIARFEALLLPHLDAAYNLARWLTHDDQEAQEIVQEAFVRALRFFGGFRGGDGRAWLLTIVRNTCFGRMRRERPGDLTTPFDEEVHGLDREEPGPETALLIADDARAVFRALEDLAVEFREVLVLREIEGLSYKEIADVTGVPIGTVMSRLARARRQIQIRLAGRQRKEV